MSDYDEEGYVNVKWLLIKSTPLSYFSGIQYDHRTKDFVGTDTLVIPHIFGKLMIKIFKTYSNK